MTLGNPRYVGGVWASSMRYRNSDRKWYWVGCINFATPYVYTAPSATGTWTQSAVIPGTCWYDCGLLIDDDDTMYVVYGHQNVSISQLSPDGLSIVKNQYVFGGPGLFNSIEGATIIWKSSDIWGPWDWRYLQNGTDANFLSGGVPNQGSLVEGPNGRWHFLSFLWQFSAGRLPVLAPITWGSDGYPILETVDGAWAASYPYPNLPSPKPSMTGTDLFLGDSLSPQWQWVLNPDTTRYSVHNGLALSTATITQDIYLAANTITHRTYGPTPMGTVLVDITHMADGDRAGFAAFSYQSAWVEVVRNGGSYLLRMVSNATQDPNNNWATVSNGTIEATIPLMKQVANSGKLWLRIHMNTLPTSNKQATFSYSADGLIFTTLGSPFTMSDSYVYFMGCRFAIFNFATKALGGGIKVLLFTSA